MELQPEKSYTYKSSKELFKENEELCKDLSELKSIIQNDMTITQSDLYCFNRQVEKLMERIYLYRSKVIQHIIKEFNPLEKQLESFEKKIHQ